MKRIAIICVISSFLGCSDFLEETSQNQIRPSTVSDMEKILEGEGYFDDREGCMFNYGTELFTDDIQCGEKVIPDDRSDGQDAVKERWERIFCWDIRMFDEVSTTQRENLDYWQVPYERIKGCNVVLDYADEVSGEDDRRAYLKGEAKALRGFYYLQLVNFFSLPYNYGDPETNPGVPLKLISGVTQDKPVRGTVAGVYRQIEQDLLEGAALMRANRQDNIMYTRMNGLAAYGLTSRMYLYMEEWDKVIQYADSVLNEESTLLHFADAAGVYNGVYSRNTPDEILWAGYMDEVSNSSMQIFSYSLYKAAFLPSDELVNTYGQDIDGGEDLRTAAGNGPSYWRIGSKYGVEERWVGAIHKGGLYYQYSGGIRTAEVYLNRAEAYLRKYVETGDAAMGQRGMDDLNRLRRSRFSSDYVDKRLEQFATPEEALDFCLRERRRELAHEGNFRWFDLRRNGMPRIEHEFFYEGQAHNIYVLEEGDSRYVLPLPETVLRRNSNLVQNEY